MNQKQAKELLPFITAFAEGKEIEWFDGIKWVSLPNPNWENLYTPIVRIKPEPKYIPFTFEDAEFLIGKLIKDKHTNSIFIIIGVNAVGIMITIDNYISFKNLLENYTFLDGSPCGKIENGEA